MVNGFSFKYQFLINETIVLVYVRCCYAILRLFALLM